MNKVGWTIISLLVIFSLIIIAILNREPTPDPNITLKVEDQQGKIKVSVSAPFQFDQVTFYLNGKIYYRAYSSQIASDSATLKRGVVTFIFDDGWVDVFDNAHPLLNKYHYPASVATISRYVDKRGAMTKRQLQKLVNKGWSLSSHSFSDDPITDLPQNMWEAALIESKLYLWQNLWGATTLVYPSGKTNDTISELAKKHYLASRIYDNGLNILPVDRYQILVRSLDVESDLDDIRMWIKEAELQKGWLVFALHHVSDKDLGFYTITPELLEETLKILTQSNVQVLDFDQAVQAISPEVAGIKENLATWEFDKNLLKSGEYNIQVVINGKYSNKTIMRI
ncbi:polysaccharide deacetylase family protein [Candidatus Daviesbacteria bacterium]|nr:polysaccharide deacetylase family protein [Candidatus Daviesbacteria bacterium]